MAIPAQSPNCNPYAERFVRTVREECLDQFVIFGEANLRHLLGKFVQHYNRERYHQGKGGKLVMPNLPAVNDDGVVGTIKKRSSPGGTLNFYHRAAARWPRDGELDPRVCVGFLTWGDLWLPLRTGCSLHTHVAR